MSCHVMNPYITHRLVWWVRSPRGGGGDSLIVDNENVHLEVISSSKDKSIQTKCEGVGKWKHND